MSERGPGCVKTCTRRECAELFSLFSSFDGDCQSGSFVIQRNRDKLSTRKFDVGVFTQPGPGTDLGTSKHIMPDPAQPHSEIEFQRLQYRSLILGGSHATARVHHRCWRGGDRAAFVSAITERVTVTIECRGTAQVRVEHLGSLREKPLLDEIDHPLHRFTLIDRVGDHPFQPCG